MPSPNDVPELTTTAETIRTMLGRFTTGHTGTNLEASLDASYQAISTTLLATSRWLEEWAELACDRSEMAHLKEIAFGLRKINKANRSHLDDAVYNHMHDLAIGRFVDDLIRLTSNWKGSISHPHARRQVRAGLRQIFLFSADRLRANVDQYGVPYMPDPRLARKYHRGSKLDD